MLIYYKMLDGYTFSCLHVIRLSPQPLSDLARDDATAQRENVPQRLLNNPAGRFHSPL